MTSEMVTDHDRYQMEKSIDRYFQEIGFRRQMRRKLCNEAALLVRSVTMDPADDSVVADEYRVTAHFYRSTSGGTVLFDVDTPELPEPLRRRRVLVAGEAFAAQSLLVAEQPEAGESTGNVAVIGTETGLSVVTRTDVVEALSAEDSGEEIDHVTPMNIDNVWPCDEYHHGVAEEASESARRTPCTFDSVVATLFTGELVALDLATLARTDGPVLHPLFLGVYSTDLLGTRLLTDDNGVCEAVDIRDIGSDASAISPYPKRYGARSDLFTSGETKSLTIETLNRNPVHVKAERIITESGVGILLHNNGYHPDVTPHQAIGGREMTKANGLSVYLHGGPEFYFTNVHDLLVDNPGLLALLDESESVFVPFLRRTTDCAGPREFTARGNLVDTPLLGHNADEVNDILNVVRHIWVTQGLEGVVPPSKGTLYAESLGGHTALGLLAYAASDEINALFRSVVVNRGLLDPYDPLTSGKFTAHQCASLRPGIDEENLPLDFLGTEDWTALNHGEEHPEVTVIVGDDDPICSVDTARTAIHRLASGGYPTSMYVDKRGSGHEESPDGARYAASRFS